MLAALDTSSSTDLVEMVVPWIFHEQEEAAGWLAGSTLVWKSSGYSTLTWAPRDGADHSREERTAWQITNYRVVLLANSPDNVTGGLDYDT